MAIFAEIIGNIGVVCFLIAYFLMQQERISPKGIAYLGLNLVGSILLMMSLTIQWNLAAFLLEAAWALISMYGIYKYIYLPGRRNGP
jgi:hypothetical protein